jgi:hypothetical protein
VSEGGGPNGRRKHGKKYFAEDEKRNLPPHGAPYRKEELDGAVTTMRNHCLGRNIIERKTEEEVPGGRLVSRSYKVHGGNQGISIFATEIR